MTQKPDRQSIKSFLLTTLGNGFVSFVISSLLLFALLHYLPRTDSFQCSVFAGFLIIILGNLAIYLLTSSLYYSRTHSSKLRELREYLENRKISLRPYQGFAEIVSFTLFFLVQPQIIVGYLILKGISGYRGGKEDEGNYAQNTGELNAIKAIGTVSALLVAVIAAAFFHNAFDLERYFGWLMKV